MSVGDLWAVKIEYFVQGRVCSVNLAYRSEHSNPGPGIARSVEDAFIADVIPALEDVWSVDVETQMIYVHGVNPAGLIPAYTHFVAQAGNRLGGAMPNDSPSVITLVTDAPNSKHNGRVYISGISETDVDSQVLTPAFRAAQWADLGDALVADITDPAVPANIYSAVVLNRMVLGVPVTPPSSFGVASFAENGNIVSQRRRRTRKREQAS